MKTKQILSAAALVLTMTACQDNKPAEADLVVLFTTDLHGAVLPYDIKRNEPAIHSLARVATYVKQARQETPDAVMLFDTGDFLQGQPSVYYYNYVDTASEHLMATAFNHLQYDAVGVGNHDIETGEAVYGRRLRQQFQMPWICANAIDTRTLKDPNDLNSGKSMFQPYAIIERQGLKIAVLGLITPNIPAWLPKSLWANLEFQDMVECAQHWVPIIQDKEKPDMLIGLFHAGGSWDANGNDMDTYKNEDGSIPVAVKVPGFDLCLLGHDHQPRNLKVLNVAGDSVQILDAQTGAKVLGRVDIHFSRQDDGSYDKSLKASLIDMTPVPNDSDYCALVQPIIDTVNAYVDAPVGQLTDPLSGINGIFGPCPFIDLIHDAQLEMTGADISLAAVLSPRDVVPAGTITMRHLFTLYKYENQLFTVQMTANEVRQYLEFGYGNQFNTMTSANDHLLAFQLDENGKTVDDAFGPKLKGITFNFTSAGGIRYRVDITKPVGERVTLLSMTDGSDIDPNRMYKVALNSYQYCGGGDFIPKGLGWDDATLAARTLSNTQMDVRRYLADYIRQKQSITPHLRGDWEIVPTDWWQKGKERDMKIMREGRR